MPESSHVTGIWIYFSDRHQREGAGRAGQHHGSDGEAGLVTMQAARYQSHGWILASIKYSVDYFDSRMFLVGDKHLRLHHLHDGHERLGSASWCQGLVANIAASHH